MDRAHVDEQRAGVRAGEDAVLADHDLAHGGGVRQHRDDHVAALGDLAWARGRLRALGRERLDGSGAAIVHDELVTGAQQGIGRAIALACAGAGADVAVNYLDDAVAAEAVCEAIRALGRRAVALQAGAIRSALDLAVLEGRRNLKYSVQGSAAIQPSEITDNGQFTALRFPNQRELPAFFAVNPDGSESIVPFDVRDEFGLVLEEESVG